MFAKIFKHKLKFPYCTSSWPNKKLFQLTNYEENHGGYQYIDGLNVLTESSHQFSHPTVKNIFKNMFGGYWVRDITLPVEDTDLKIISDNENWYANKFILGDRRKLSDLSTIKYLVANGADIHINSSIMELAIHQDYYDIMISLVQDSVPFRQMLDYVEYYVADTAGIDVNNSIMEWAICRGHYDIVKYLVQNDVVLTSILDYLDAKPIYHMANYLIRDGIKFNIRGNFLLKQAIYNYNFVMINSLVKNGLIKPDLDGELLHAAIRCGYFDVVIYLIENNISTNRGLALVRTIRANRPDMTKYLLDNGAECQYALNYYARHGGSHLNDIKTLVEYDATIIASNNGEAIKLATENNHMDIVDYLTFGSIRKVKNNMYIC